MDDLGTGRFSPAPHPWRYRIAVALARWLSDRATAYGPRPILDPDKLTLARHRADLIAAEFSIGTEPNWRAPLIDKPLNFDYPQRFSDPLTEPHLVTGED